MKTSIKRFTPNWAIKLFRLFQMILNEPAFISAKHNFANRSFLYCGNSFRYFIARHNKTWTNERSIEIPIALQAMEGVRPDTILEIGNVLSHYFSVQHSIVDKYEKHKDVVNIDIVDYRPKKLFHLIVSISTYEHIGHDEQTRYGLEQIEHQSKSKLIDAINQAKNLLEPGGKLLITAPVGYNPHLDAIIINNEIPFTNVVVMTRVNLNNEWLASNIESIRNVSYNKPYPCANGLYILSISKN